MSERNLLIERRDHVAFVTFNRPKVLNALNDETLEELDSCLLDIRSNSDIRVVVFTGAGEKAFIAGADITELARFSPQEGMECSLRGQALFDRVEDLGKPTIAAINGYALGGGCEFALACTIRIASRTARIGLPELKIGIIPAYGGTQRLPRLIGKGMALQMMLTSEFLSAEDALRCGLVTQVVVPDQLLPTAESIARKIIANAPLAVQYCVEAVTKGLETSRSAGMRLEASLSGMCFATEDMHEGTRAFLEKRTAQFIGR
jgi:enoyl-CoA hydratase